jgi:ketosteroid isomerase-like protein
VDLSRCWRNLGSVIAAAAVIGLAPALAQTARAQPQAPKASAAAEDPIRDATMLFYVAFNSALHGDLDPLSSVWSHRPDVSNLSAAGGWASGWNEVHAAFRDIARLYPDGRIAPQDILVVADGDMGFSVCRETGQLRSAEGPMVKFNQRATNIFRLEDGKWKLIHHHADSSSSGSQEVTR